MTAKVHFRTRKGKPDFLFDYLKDLKFPVLAGSHLLLANHRLELCKQILHVFQLDARFRSEADKLRKVLAFS